MTRLKLLLRRMYMWIRAEGLDDFCTAEKLNFAAQVLWRLQPLPIRKQQLRHRPLAREMKSPRSRSTPTPPSPPPAVSQPFSQPRASVSSPNLAPHTLQDAHQTPLARIASSGQQTGKECGSWQCLRPEDDDKQQLVTRIEIIPGQK